MSSNSNTSWNGQRRSFPAKVAKRILAQATGCALAYPGVCTTTPREVDHIVGVADALALGWSQQDIDDPANAAAVCPDCHRVKTKAEQDRGRARAAARRPSARRPAAPHPGLKR